MAKDTEPLLHVEHPAPGLAVLTLDRPNVRNALSMPLRRAFVMALRELCGDGRTRVLILTGQGSAFCAGLDLAELSEGPAPGEPSPLDAGPDHDVVAALSAFPGATIGAINGATATGGLELALACDVLIASSAARFADTHGRVGVIPGWGLSQRLPRRIGIARAKEMSFTGNYVDAELAQAWGLVNHVVAPEELMPRALKIAGDMLDAVPGFLARYKTLVDEGMSKPLPEALAMERATSAEWQATFRADELAGRRAAIQGRGRV